MVRVSGIGDFYSLKNDLYRWNENYKGYVRFDDIKVRRVSWLGWFAKFHAKLHSH